METIKFAPCYIWSAYSFQTIGSKCGFPHAFETALADLVRNHDTSQDRAKGQHFIVLSKESIKNAGITCGVGKRTLNPDDYVVRVHREKVGMFLKREHALPVSFCAVIVYTKEAMLKDPQSTDEYRAEVEASDATHYLIALLANGEGVPSPAPRSPFRLCDCLAGGNEEAKAWTMEEVAEMAKASVEYATEFCVVAD